MATKTRKKVWIINIFFWSFFAITLSLSIWYATINPETTDEVQRKFAQVWDKIGNILIFFNIPIWFLKTKSLWRNFNMTKKLYEEKMLKAKHGEERAQEIIKENAKNKAIQKQVDKSKEKEEHQDLKKYLETNLSIVITDRCVYEILKEIHEDVPDFNTIANLIMKDTNIKPDIITITKLYDQWVKH